MLNNKIVFDFAVIGGGLAGLAIADKLIGQGANVILIEKDKIAAGASGTPLGLVNPATGRFGSKSWEAEKCYHSILMDLEKIQQYSPDSIFKKNGIIRPALDNKIAAKMQENVNKTQWPEGWCSWLDTKELAEINPDLFCMEGGLWLPIGITVNIPAYLQEKAKLLQLQGLKIITDTDFDISQDHDGFLLSSDNGKKIKSGVVIYATGIQSKETRYWKDLPLIAVKGQIAILTKPNKVNLDVSVSALGYLGSLSSETFVMGSTYEHSFDHSEPDGRGFDYMKTRLKMVYPTLFSHTKLLNQWSGIRASTPDRMPLIGCHPEIENLYIFAGLGSKGLLYSSYMADQFVQFLTKRSDLPKEVTIGRFR